LLGDAYAALGRLGDAAAQYDTLAQGLRIDFRDLFSDAPIRPLAHERLGALYLTLGDTAAAVAHLARFAELWSNADPELQPRVEAARRTLAGLTGERR
jgi:tetratricopeptide (TPR) repeat protein